jgi:DNA invertase Pin-like site-specific DNA recombinase
MSTQSNGRAVGLVRVSSDKQAESGLGLAAQRASIAAAAARLGLPLVQVFEEAGISGTLPIDKRPVLLDAIAALRRGDILLLARRDRLSRDVIVSAMAERLITKRGARMVSAAGESSEGDDPASIMMRRMLDVFSAYEAAVIAARTRAALAAKRRRGERAGFVPFGWRVASDGRMLELAADEQQTLSLIRKRRAAGESLTNIADHLNDVGVRTRAGTPFRFEYVRSLLRRAG